MTKGGKGKEKERRSPLLLTMRRRVNLRMSAGVLTRLFYFTSQEITACKSHGHLSAKIISLIDHVAKLHDHDNAL